MGAAEDFVAGVLTKESLEMALERFWIDEAKRPGPDGVVAGPSVEYERGFRALIEALCKRFGL